MLWISLSYNMSHFHNHWTEIGQYDQWKSFKVNSLCLQVCRNHNHVCFLRPAPFCWFGTKKPFGCNNCQRFTVIMAAYAIFSDALDVNSFILSTLSITDGHYTTHVKQFVDKFIFSLTGVKFLRSQWNDFIRSPFCLVYWRRDVDMVFLSVCPSVLSNCGSGIVSKRCIYRQTFS